jgi:hypothetical protein
MGGWSLKNTVETGAGAGGAPGQTPQGSRLAAAFVIRDKALNARRFLLQSYRGYRH